MSDELFKSSMTSMLKWMDPLEYSLWGCKILEAVSFLVTSSPRERVLPYIHKILTSIVTSLGHMRQFKTQQRGFLFQGVTRIYNSGNYGNGYIYLLEK